MRFREVVCCSVVTILGCGGAVRPRATEPSREALLSAHFPPTEAIVTNAGAARCTMAPSKNVTGGQIENDADFAVGFGQRGGLVAWSASDGLHVGSVREDGEIAKSETVVKHRSTDKPIEIVPIGQGFLVVVKHVVQRSSVCEARCVDATCAGSPEGAPQPHVCFRSCSKPCMISTAHEFVLHYVNLLGQTIGEPKSWRTGLVDLAAVLPGDGRSLGLLTGNEVVWVHTNERYGLTVKLQAFVPMHYALPIRGPGTPALLALAEEGSARLLDEAGEHLLAGNLVDPRAGRLFDARLQARRDAQGRIHVAKQAWQVSRDSIQYSVIEGDSILHVGEIERGGFREPFAEYVEPHWENGRFGRHSWLQRTIGTELDVHQIDPDADLERARFVWTGKTFLVVYPTAQTSGKKLRSIAIRCAP